MGDVFLFVIGGVKNGKRWYKKSGVPVGVCSSGSWQLRNQVDRCILELQMEAEDMYSRFRNAIENVNVIIATYNDALMGDVQVQPEKGTVAFGSGLHGWGFTTDAWLLKGMWRIFP